jgi:hypothetical protein
MYCEAVKLAGGAGLAGEKGRARLLKFRHYEKQLRSEYADVLGAPEAATHVELMEKVLREAREELNKCSTRPPAR